MDVVVLWIMVWFLLIQWLQVKSHYLNKKKEKKLGATDYVSLTSDGENAQICYYKGCDNWTLREYQKD